MTYEITAEGKFQVEMNQYGRPDHGFELENNYPISKGLIDKAIDAAYEKHEEMSNHFNQDKDISAVFKQELINTYSFYEFLKTLNFDVEINPECNL
jgi:hypothetical protein